MSRARFDRGTARGAYVSLSDIAGRSRRPPKFTGRAGRINRPFVARLVIRPHSTSGLPAARVDLAMIVRNHPPEPVIIERRGRFGRRQLFGRRRTRRYGGLRRLSPGRPATAAVVVNRPEAGFARSAEHVGIVRGREVAAAIAKIAAHRWKAKPFVPDDGAALRTPPGALVQRPGGAPVELALVRSATTGLAGRQDCQQQQTATTQ